MATSQNPIIANPQAILQTPLVDQNQRIIRNWYPYFAKIQQLLSSAYLPVIAASDYGADSNGVRDTSAALIAAYKVAVAQGGGIIYIGPGAYRLISSIVLTGNVPVIFMGAGRSTILIRDINSNIPQGQGIWDLQGASNITFANFLQDGATTVSVGLLYSQLNGDPRNPLLTLNSSFWLHDGCSNIGFNDIVITHTGGYSVIADASAQDITDLYFYKLQLENNRPNLFGFTSGDMTYGAWNGGVLFSGNGVSSTAMVRHARFLECSAKRCNGNAFWLGHLYGFSSLHEDIQIDNTTGEDLGRDLIQPGGVANMRINGVKGRRIGYTTQNDTDQSVPKWLSAEWAVGIDIGVCYGMTVNNVHLVSCNGGGFDIDGAQYVEIDNFSVRVPLPGEFEYNEDQIGSVGWAGATAPGGPNAAYGMLLAQASYNVMGEGNHQIGDGLIVNCSNGAIKIYGSKNNQIGNLNIYHPAANTGAPISIGNLSPAAKDHSTGNVLSAGIRVQYSPATAKPCVYEDGSVSPFVSTDVNYVLGVVPVDPSGNAIAFQKDANSGSIGSVTAALTSPTTLDFTAGFLTGHS